MRSKTPFFMKMATSIYAFSSSTKWVEIIMVRPFSRLRMISSTTCLRVRMSTPLSGSSNIITCASRLRVSARRTLAFMPEESVRILSFGCSSMR